MKPNTNLSVLMTLAALTVFSLTVVGASALYVRASLSVEAVEMIEE